MAKMYIKSLPQILKTKNDIDMISGRHYLYGLLLINSRFFFYWYFKFQILYYTRYAKLCYYITYNSYVDIFIFVSYHYVIHVGW